MPVYLEIAHTLEQEITNQYSGGDYLPSEKMLAERFEVNRHTIRRAVDELITVGKVHRQQGKGCMVLAQPLSYPLHAKAAFTSNLLEQGSHPRCEVLKAHLIHANSDLAQQLNVELDSRIIHIRTLRKVDGRPFAVIEQYLANLNWWPVLQNFKSGSLHQFLRDNLGVTLTRSKTRIGAYPPNHQTCRLLQITPSLPLLTVKTLNVISGTEMVAEYSSSSTRSDLMELVVDH
ncbi:phosphonate metabolism transcriptional regulator PhnF [Vibrio rumoiensis]|uniref:Phosphonate metabolism transcriptional regulator PhnF n=1 Tax=Vibrio rumoiensis 1S-45 TaxID=1188252 RepID=A0A1E5E5H5_9VIBR|nr:phosphonate metabolism transcriptional regulator PhnF [Vibrio rumoiensis]OEF28980.1 phosphonate metabolism transcriptional regulator PhnF [Vibrio rumoiensis 1S-45]